MEQSNQLNKEIFNDEQKFLPDNFISTENYSKPANIDMGKTGRFNSPLNFLDKLNAALKNKVAGLTNDNNNLFAFHDFSYPVPDNWQKIVSFLYSSGVTTSPFVSFGSPFNDMPKFFALRLVNRLDSEPTDGKTVSVLSYGRGVSRNFEEAISKTIGEVLERYPLTVYQRRNFTRASMKHLTKAKKNFLNIFDLAGFAEWQKELSPKRKFDEKSEFFWAEGKEILSGKNALIPAELIFWNYNVSQEPEEPFLREQNTNGAAGHFTFGKAALSGIYENIQRDAFLIHWLNSLPPKRVDQNTIKNNDLKDTILQLNRYNFEVVLLDTTLDIPIPSCICILIDKSGVGPKISIGGGCEVDMEKALARSINEALGIYSWIRTINEPLSLDKEYKPFVDHSIDQKKRMIIWRDKKAFSVIEHFVSGPIKSLDKTGYPAGFASPTEELSHVKQIFKNLKDSHAIYVYEARHEVLKTLGYHSVKVVIPSLVPLYLRENNAPLGSKRLKDIPRKLGLKPAETFNPWPHPFP